MTKDGSIVDLQSDEEQDNTDSDIDDVVEAATLMMDDDKDEIIGTAYSKNIDDDNDDYSDSET